MSCGCFYLEYVGSKPQVCVFPTQSVEFTHFHGFQPCVLRANPNNQPGRGKRFLTLPKPHQLTDIPARALPTPPTGLNFLPPYLSRQARFSCCFFCCTPYFPIGKRVSLLQKGFPAFKKRVQKKSPTMKWHKCIKVPKCIGGRFW